MSILSDIPFIGKLIDDYGEKLVVTGIEKLTGVDLSKKELTNEEKQKIMDSKIEIMNIDFKSLELGYKDKDSARNFGVNIQASQDWLVRNTGSIIALFTMLSAFVLDIYILNQAIGNGVTSLNPIVTLIAGATSTKAVQVLGFYFGDSKVNADKQRLN